MKFSGIFGSFKCVEGDEKCMCNLQNEGSSERSRASESKARRFSGRLRGSLEKGKKVVPWGVGTFLNWLLPVSVTGCKLQLKDAAVAI